LFGGLGRRRGGCHGCHGACHGAHACHGAPACTGTPVDPKKMPVEKKKTEEVSLPTPASIVVNLPAEARLTIDGNATTSSSTRRTFVSPNLEPGADYYYTLTAEVVVNGRTLSQTQRVQVRAGETTNVPFNFASEAVAVR
jgi:uncharacterized protein (TIGR03000 family)